MDNTLSCLQAFGCFERDSVLGSIADIGPLSGVLFKDGTRAACLLTRVVAAGLTSISSIVALSRATALFQGLVGWIVIGPPGVRLGAHHRVTGQGNLRVSVLGREAPQ